MNFFDEPTSGVISDGFDLRGQQNSEDKAGETPEFSFLFDDNNRSSTDQNQEDQMKNSQMESNFNFQGFFSEQQPPSKIFRKQNKEDPGRKNTMHKPSQTKSAVVVKSTDDELRSGMQERCREQMKIASPSHEVNDHLISCNTKQPLGDKAELNKSAVSIPTPPEMSTSSAVNTEEVQLDSCEVTKEDDEARAALYLSRLDTPDYQPLQYALAEIQSAEDGEEFSRKVANSVDILYKCTKAYQKNTLVDLQEAKAVAIRQIEKTFDEAAKLHETARMQQSEQNDVRLKKLSAVLSDIKTTHEEVMKFKNMLAAFHSDLNEA